MRIHAAWLQRILLCLLIVALGACKDAPPEPEAVLLRVDSRTVSPRQFKAAFAKTMPSDQDLSEEEKDQLRRAFLVQLIDQQLLLSEADRLDIAVSPVEVQQAVQAYQKDYPKGAFQKMLAERGTTLLQWQEELREGLLVEKVIDQAVYASITVSEEEVAARYEKNKARYDVPEQVRARQIVVETAEEGQQVLETLQQGEPFADVARRHSLSPDSEVGGDLGFFPAGQMPPAFDAAVFSLPVGRLSELVQSDYGYHIFLVEEKRSARMLTVEDVREDILQELYAEKRERDYQRWLQNLRARATIEVNWSLL